MGLRPGGRFRRVRGCGVDWYAGIRGGGAGLDWETCENGNSEVFGHGYGRSLVQDQHLDALAGLTAAQALSAGEQPRVVWNVLCDHMGVPDPQRWGSDHNAPPMPVR